MIDKIGVIKILTTNYSWFTKCLIPFIFVFQRAFTSSDKSFKISIESFNKKLSINQQRELIDVSKWLLL